MSEVILVAGSFLGARCWDRVRSQLTRAGKRSTAVELTGLGVRSDEEATLNNHIQDVLEALESANPPALVVAHSYAGVPAALAVARTNSELRKNTSLTFLGSNLPHAGRSIFDDFGQGACYLRKLALKHDGKAIPVFTRSQLEGWGDHGLVGNLYAQFVEVASPHPIATFEDRADEDFTWDRLIMKPTFVDLTRDTMTCPEETQKMSMRHLDSGHWPMLTAPRQLADLIIDLCPEPRHTISSTRT